MSHKLTQQETVAEILKKQGYVSRNTCIDTRLTIRLSSIIERLRNGHNWNISGKAVGSDYIYYLEK